MANSHGIVHAAARTTTGTQDYTQTGLGTIKGLLFLGSDNPSINTTQNDLGISIGASDLAAVPGVMMGVNYEDNVATTDCKKMSQNDHIYGISGPGAWNPDSEADFDSQITDGVRIDWPTIVEGTGRRTSAIMLKEGIDQLEVIHQEIAGTGSTTVTCGFTPDVLLVLDVASTVSPDNNGYNLTVGMYHRADDVYATVGVVGFNGQTTPVAACSFKDNKISGTVNSATNIWFNDFTVDSFTGTGFDMTKVSGTGAGDHIFICIKLAAGYSAKVGNFASPGSTGVASVISGLAFTPQIAFFIASSVTDTTDGTDTAKCSISFGAACLDDEDAVTEVAQGGTVEDFTEPALADSRGNHREDACLFLIDETGSIPVKATLDSFPTGGVDLNYTIATASWDVTTGYLVIGPDNVQSPQLPYFSGKQRTFDRR